MNKRNGLMIGGVMFALFLCGCLAVAGFMMYGASLAAQEVNVELEKLGTATPEIVLESNPVPDAVAAANQFLSHVGNLKYTEATATTSSELRGDPGTPDLLRAIVEEKGLQPDNWEWQQQKEDVEKGETYLEGDITYADGREGQVTVHLERENDQWMVYYLDLKPAGGEQVLDLDESDPAQIAADVFLEFWKNGEFGPAYQMGSIDFQQQVGAPEKLEEILKGTGLLLDSWTWETAEILEHEGTGLPVVQLLGTAAFQDGGTGRLEVQLIEEEGNWVVLFFDVSAE